MPEAKNHPYLPHTESERKEMLKVIGVDNFEQLLEHIPKEIRAKELSIAQGLSELELTEHIVKLAEKNIPASKQASFLGAGSYRRFTPAVVQSVISRSEFATAYTPYQPEVSQGSLQAIYEFQTAICLLTGMDVSNASLYDGPTAAAEAVLMASRLNNKQLVVVADTVNPEYKQVIETYVKAVGLSLRTAPFVDGIVDSNIGIDNSTSALVVQYPNYFGNFEDMAKLANIAHAANALLIVVTDPISLGLLTPPAEFGADIVVGDAQPCGNSLSFGGPSAGYLACRNDFVRQLPGRVCGITQDKNGQRAFTLTLQTREQHIRRAKATSNICTNQALNALAMLVYLTLMGPNGLKQIAEISVKRAHYLQSILCDIAGVSVAFTQKFFNEFVLNTPMEANLLLSKLKAKGVLGGLALSRYYPQMPNAVLVATTEMNTPAQLHKYKEVLAEILQEKSQAAAPKFVGSGMADARKAGSRAL
jgi:glycine dehydrogenase subunit 1